jgi:hypothetical protein
VTGNSNIGVIVPAVVVPVGVVLIVVGIVVAVFLARREKREGVNFIPLEKKDFTKIIYGDQLNQQPEKGSGNLKDLEAVLFGLVFAYLSLVACGRFESCVCN